MERKYEKEYEEYLKQELPNRKNYEPFLKKMNWCIQNGRSIIAPHPHRHFSYEEFENKINICMKFENYVKLLN